MDICCIYDIGKRQRSRQNRFDEQYDSQKLFVECHENDVGLECYSKMLQH